MSVCPQATALGLRAIFTDVDTLYLDNGVLPSPPVVASGAAVIAGAPARGAVLSPRCRRASRSALQPCGRFFL